MEGVAITIVDRYAAKPCQSTGEMTDRSTVPVPDMPPGLDYEFFGFLSATPLGPIDKSEATIAGHPGLVATIPLPDGALPECGGAVYYTWTGTNEQDRGAQGFVSGLDWKVYAMDVHGTLVTIESWAPHDRFATFQPLAEAFLASLSLDFGASGGH